MGRSIGVRRSDRIRNTMLSSKICIADVGYKTNTELSMAVAYTQKVHCVVILCEPYGGCRRMARHDKTDQRRVGGMIWIHLYRTGLTLRHTECCGSGKGESWTQK